MIRKEKVSTNIIKNIGKDYECPICYGNLNLNDSMICTECNHIFHYKCIKLAIEKNILKCPLCRRSLRNIDINNNDNINNNYYRINHRNNYDNQRNLNNYNNANINNNNMNNHNNNSREVNNIQNFLENSILLMYIVILLIPEVVFNIFLIIFIAPLFFFKLFLDLGFIILRIIAELNPEFAYNVYNVFIIIHKVLSKLFYFVKLLFIIPLYLLKGFFLVQIFMIFMILFKLIVKKGIIYLIIEIKKEIIDLIIELINIFLENKKLGSVFLFCHLYFFIKLIRIQFLKRRRFGQN